MARSWEDRVAEYVDSPALRARVKSGKTITCRIEGNYGEYVTTMKLGRGDKSTCTCPAEGRPCKHIEALRRTYRANPTSFVDLDALLDGLGRRTKAEIVEVVRAMVMRAPGTLAVLGVEEFDEEEGDHDIGWLKAAEP